MSFADATSEREVARILVANLYEVLQPLAAAVFRAETTDGGPPEVVMLSDSGVPDAERSAARAVQRELEREPRVPERGALHQGTARPARPPVGSNRHPLAQDGDDLLRARPIALRGREEEPAGVFG